MKITKKGNAMPINEHTIFGENSASAVIIISATSSKIGTIIHCNEEIENVLKYKRQELIGKNVSILTPRPIAKVHDRLVQRYFETAKPTVIEIKRQLFGVTKEGYLQEIELIVKVLPEINDKLIFVGFMQKTDRFEDMEPPSGEMDRHDKQYLVTDYDGNITNVTEGLMYDLGLHSKFFNYSDSIFQ
jgi:PAS domain S-box-containing protein